MSEDQLREAKEKAKVKLTEQMDSKDRLTVHAFVLRLCLANGLAMYHSQVSAVLKAEVKLSQVGPELMSIDRARLASSLGVLQALNPAPKLEAGPPASAEARSRNTGAGSSMEQKVKQLRQGRSHKTITEEDSD